MKIILFSQFFPPETGAAPHRAFYHAKNWVKMGHEVIVVTNFPNSPIGKIYEGYKNRFLKKEIIEDITVIRLLTLPAGKKSSIIRRFFSSLFYVIMAKVCFFQKRPDVIIGSAPYFAGFAAFLIAKFRRIPLVYELRDPWLQILGKNAQKTGIYFKILEKIEKKMLHHSDKVVVIGNKMSQVIKKRYELANEPVPIFNGIETSDIADIPDVLPPQIRQKMEGVFRIGFVGNLGVWYDYEVVIKAADLLKNQKIAFFFLGDGKLKKEFTREVNRLSLPNIHIFDVLPHKQALAVVRSCDLTILPFRKGVCDLCLPLKFFESLGLGTPVLACNGEEVGIIIRESGSGACFESDNPEQLAAIIRDYVKKNTKLGSQGNTGKKYIVENFNRWIMAKKYEELFSSVISKKKQK